MLTDDEFDKEMFPDSTKDTDKGDNDEKAYSFEGVGKVNPGIWLKQFKLGLDGCLDLVKTDSRCSQEYFFYATESDENCGCKTDKDTPLEVNDVKGVNYYKINNPGDPCVDAAGVNIC